MWNQFRTDQYEAMLKRFRAIVDCWGGNIVAQTEPTPKTPVAPVDYARDLSCPVLGLFGNDDQNPTPDKVNQLEAELKKMARNTSSTAMTERATVVGLMTALPTGRSKPWMPGPKSFPFLPHD
jgi:hypothetical protein